MSAMCWTCLLALVAQSAVADEAAPARQVIQPALQHVRSGTEREWSEFPKAAQGERLEVSFASTRNATEQTLLVRQQDVKQLWQVTLNGQKLGELVRDENDMIVAFAVPAGCLIDGDSKLKVESPGSGKATSDDIRIGQVELVDCPLRDLLREAVLDIEVIDSDSKEALPCRITILNHQGAMYTLGAESNDHLAVRPGTVYSSTGRAAVGVPAGRYKIFAGRGFEYSLDQAEVDIARGETVKKRLSIRREVPTQGYVACDTHVHTLTHSGHGDATIEERMITLAGEGIELPIATDHNKYIDFEPSATKMNVRRYLTPVIGNEVTTPNGHFNIFPVAAGATIVNAKQTDWGLLLKEIRQTPGVKAIILNHAQDVHGGFRPFGPEHHNSLVGENLDGRPLGFNAMEIINSGATQSDPLRLCRDWIGLLNRGHQVTPVGSSDSHDVARHFVGQGRTYIRCDDQDPARIDIDAAATNFVAGRVMVSYGLLAELTVNGQHRSGDLATGLGESEVRVDVRVLGPHWSRASRVQLLANGNVIREAEIAEKEDSPLPAGVKWAGGWTIPRPAHDVHLIALATGPGIDGFYWRTAKPYQPVSPDWQGRTMGCSGAVWLDIDNDGRATAAREYAERLVAAARQDWTALLGKLSTYDEAVAAHVAHIISRSGTSLQSEPLIDALKGASAATQSAFQAYREASRENEVARAQR